MRLTVRRIRLADRDWARAMLSAQWGSPQVARMGQVIDAGDLDGFVAIDATDDRVGLCLVSRSTGSFAPTELVGSGLVEGLEVVAILSLVPRIGVGRALLDAAWAECAQTGAERLWLCTTNDNVHAQHLYESWGLTLVGVFEEGVAASRVVKPTIPLMGDSGTPIDDELLYVRDR